jgi:hypothetical protein
MAQAGACYGREETKREAERAGSKTWARATVLAVGTETAENETRSLQVRRREILTGALRKHDNINEQAPPATVLAKTKKKRSAWELFFRLARFQEIKQR